MANITTREKSPFWIACYTDANKKQMKRSTKLAATEENKAAAMEMAQQFEKAATGQLSVAQARTVLTDLMAASGQAIEPVTIRQWTERWLARKKPEVAKTSGLFYEGTINMWINWLGPKASLGLASLTLENLVEFRNWLATRVSNTSVNHRMGAIVSILRAAHAEKVIDSNPGEHLRMLKKGAGGHGRQPFTPQQIRALLQVSDPEWRSMIIHGAYTGQRLSDVAMLRWENIDLARKTINLQTRKTGRWMNLPMADALYDHLLAWNAGRESRNTQFPEKVHPYVHPDSAGHVLRTGLCARLSNEFAEIMVNAGIRKLDAEVAEPDRSEERTQFSHSFHSLRHTATSWMREAGVSSSVVMEFIGHDDATISRIYTHTGDDAMRKAAESLPALT